MPLRNEATQDDSTSNWRTNYPPRMRWKLIRIIEFYIVAMLAPSQILPQTMNDIVQVSYIIESFLYHNSASRKGYELVDGLRERIAKLLHGARRKKLVTNQNCRKAASAA